MIKIPNWAWEISAAIWMIGAISNYFTDDITHMLIRIAVAFICIGNRRDNG